MPKTPAKPHKKAAADRIEVRTPNVAGYSHTVAAAPYHAMRKVLLRILPPKAPGLTQAEMWERAEATVPKAMFPDKGKVAWWTKCVQLDLEARGEVTREHSKPLRWHRRA